MPTDVYEPKGIRFFDTRSQRDMVLVEEDHPFNGWICFRHPDGQWVTLRKATDADREVIRREVERDEAIRALCAELPVLRPLDRLSAR